MSRSQLEENLDRLLDELGLLMKDRHEKYGPGNISKHGMTGLVVRLGDKMARLENGLENYGDESLEDTLMDIAGYALIGLLWERGQWPGQEKPLADWERELMEPRSWSCRDFEHRIDSRNGHCQNESCKPGVGDAG